MRKILTLLFITAVLLTSVSALADSVKAVANPTYVRTGPGLDYKTIDYLPGNTYYEWGGQVAVDDRGVEWYSIYYANGIAWVSSLHANLVSSSGEGYSRNGAYLKDTSVYAVYDASVHTGPAGNYGTIGTLYSGQSADFTGFRQTDSCGVTWYQINYYGNSGWVSSLYTGIW